MHIAMAVNLSMFVLVLKLKSFSQIVIQIRLNRLLLLFRGLTRETRGLEEGSVSGKE